MPAEYVPTDAHRALVESASAFGITQAEIATQLKISEPTLRKHFRDELDGGAFKANIYHEFKADRLIAERNFGGALVEHVIRTAEPNIAYREVIASRGNCSG